MRQRFFTVLALAAGLMVGVLIPLQGYCDARPLPLESEAVRPGANTGPTQIAMGIWIVDISRIDSVSQTFSANLVLMMRWVDPGLAHSSPGVERYNLDDVWHPDWLVANASEPVARTLPEIVEVSGDGTVTYRQRLLGIFSQSLDLHAFPFDKGAFRIQFVMVGQQPQEIEFVPIGVMVAAGLPMGAGIAPELTLKDWRVTGFSAGASTYRIAPGFEQAAYVFEFKAQRVSAHYIVKVIIPLLLIVMMSWATFWIDPSLGSSQISVATTSMLTLIAYRFAVGADVPKLSYLTNLDAFILVSSLLVLITLIEVIATTTLARNDRLELARKIDGYSRVIFPVAYVAVFVVTLFK